MRCIYHDYDYDYGYDYRLSNGTTEYTVTDIIVRKSRWIDFPGGSSIAWRTVATAPSGTYSMTPRPLGGPYSIPILEQIFAEGPGVKILEPLHINDDIYEVEYKHPNGEIVRPPYWRVILDANPGDNAFFIGSV